MRGLLTLSMLVGCVPGVDPDREDFFPCADSSDCLSGFVCSGEGYCVRSNRPEDPETVAVVAVYSEHGDWNSYVRRSDPHLDSSHQPTPVVGCDGTEVEDGWAACIHGGEKRKAVVSTRSTCAGLSATDERNAFDWVCLEEEGAAVFYSRALRVGQGLATLVTEAGFVEQSLTVRDGDTVVGRSPLAGWWSNPVVPLPAGAGFLVLDRVDDDGAGPDQAFDDGTVFVLESSRRSAGYNIDLNACALVVQPPATLIYDGTQARNCTLDGEHGGETTDHRCLVAAGNQGFLWIEGAFDGRAVPASTHSVVRLVDAAFVRVREVTTLGGTNSGIRLNHTNGGVFEGIRVAHASTGLLLHESGKNRIDRVVAANNREGEWASCVELMESSNENSLTRLTCSGSAGAGIVIRDSSHNRFSLITSLNNGTTGLSVNAGADQNYISQVTVANNDGAGVRFVGDPPADGVRLSQVVSVNNGSGISIVGESNDHVFAHIVSAHNHGSGIWIAELSDAHFVGRLLVGNNGGSDCAVGLATTNVGAPDCSETEVDLEVSTGVDLTGTHVGRAGDDTENADDLIDELRDFAAITDWLRFEDIRRAWGPGSVPESTAEVNRGPCVGDDVCAIWDWRVSPTDTAIRHLHGEATPGVPCPPAVHGDQIMQPTDSKPAYLRAATEIIGDEIGNDDGLCESGEACLYASTPGSHPSDERTGYQCLFEDGEVVGVTMTL